MRFFKLTEANEFALSARLTTFDAVTEGAIAALRGGDVYTDGRIAEGLGWSWEELREFIVAMSEDHFELSPFVPEPKEVAAVDWQTLLEAVRVGREGWNYLSQVATHAADGSFVPPDRVTATNIVEAIRKIIALYIACRRYMPRAIFDDIAKLFVTALAWPPRYTSGLVEILSIPPTTEVPAVTTEGPTQHAPTPQQEAPAGKVAKSKQKVAAKAGRGKR